MADFPYHSPFPSPKNLSIYSNTVLAKYKAIYPSRDLIFPINFWKITLCSQKTHIIGNGVIAEILLFLNTNSIIYQKSLEPEISALQLGSCLKNLSNILVKEGEGYSLMQNLPSGEIFIESKEIQYEIQESETLNSSDDPVIDCSIMSILKAKRRMKVDDLIFEVQTRLEEKFFVSEVDIQKRIETLISLGYAQQKQSEKWIHFVPPKT